MIALFSPILGNPALFLLFVGWLGLIAGSFLNVVIYRIPVMMERSWRVDAPPADEKPFNLCLPRSHCPHCGHNISAIGNIPVLSYLVLRGRCSSCQSPISIRYPMVEAGTAVLSVVIAYHFGPTMQTAGILILSWAVIALAGIDHDTQLLPDMITLPLIWVGLLFNLNATFIPLQSAVIGAVVGYLSLWVLYSAMKLSTGRESMGYGDFKLAAALGAWFGWHALPGILVLAAVIGLVVQIIKRLLTKEEAEPVFAFGPYLAGASLIFALGADLLVTLPLWRIFTFS